MSGASLSAKRGGTPAPVAPRPEDRWASPGGPVGQFSLGMALVVLASLAIHAILVATALTDGSRAQAAQQEISVEIIQEKPADAPKAKSVKPQAAKLESAKLAVVKPADPAPALKPTLAEQKPPEPKAADPKLADVKPAEVKPNAPKAPEPARPEPRLKPPAGTAQDKPGEDKPAEARASSAKLATLEKEFETLKAERAALEAAHDQAEQAEATAATAARPIDAGMGPLPDSFQAVALPAAGDGAGEAVDYRELVFSELAKAKGLGETKGLPGTAGVHFTIDETGHLASIAIVHRSGVRSLDDQALAIVRKAAPFPPPPQGAQRSFDANVNFVVEGQR